MHPGVVMGKFRLVYVVVENDTPTDNDQSSSRCRFINPKYTRATLTSALQLMGCKARHAHTVSRTSESVSRGIEKNQIEDCLAQGSAAKVSA